MPRTYKRKTTWGGTSLEELEMAAAEVKAGKKIRATARDRNIDMSTLLRFLKKLDPVQLGICLTVGQLQPHSGRLTEEWTSFVNCAPPPPPPPLPSSSCPPPPFPLLLHLMTSSIGDVTSSDLAFIYW